MKGTIFHELAHILGVATTQETNPPRIRSVVKSPGANEVNAERGAYAEERLLGGVFGAVVVRGKGLSSTRGVFLRLGAQVQTAGRPIGRDSAGKPYPRVAVDEEVLGSTVEDQYIISECSFLSLFLLLVAELSSRRARPSSGSEPLLPSPLPSTHPGLPPPQWTNP